MMFYMKSISIAFCSAYKLRWYLHYQCTKYFVAPMCFVNNIMQCQATRMELILTTFMIHIIRCYATILINICPWYIKRQMSRIMRKPIFSVCENKDADQLHDNREADQRLCFRYIHSPIPLLS